MRKIYSKIFVAIALSALVSCSGFLDTKHYTQVTESEFYKTEDDMMKGLYAVIGDVKGRLMEIWAYNSILSDEAETGGGLGEGVWKEKFDKFTYSASNCFGEWGYGSWWNEWDFGIYNGVIDACLIIDKLQASSLGDSFTKPIEAEARFYRALFYTYLFMGYEQFPLIKNYLAASEMYSIKKGTRDEIFEFMMEDLADDWINFLPDRASTEQGRVCKDAAKVLRTKIILFHRSEANYAKALNDMKSIINSGFYALDPDFKHLWVKDGEWGRENIYDVAYGGNGSGTGNGWSYGLGGRDMVDPRSAEQGGLVAGYGQNTMSTYVYNKFSEGDKRREGTIIDYREEARKVEQLVAEGKLPEGSSFYVSDKQENFEWMGHYKYAPRKENAPEINISNNVSVPFRFYRYADVLLLATELEARVNGSVSNEGQKWFDQVRDRAFGDTHHRISLSGKSKQEILDIIFAERGLEFVDEMQRFFDIMRFDKGTEVLGSKGWTEKYRYFPIDQSEMDRAKGYLTQNPGWAN